MGVVSSIDFFLSNAANPSHKIGLKIDLGPGAWGVIFQMPHHLARPAKAKGYGNRPLGTLLLFQASGLSTVLYYAPRAAGWRKRGAQKPKGHFVGLEENRKPPRAGSKRERAPIGVSYLLPGTSPGAFSPPPPKKKRASWPTPVVR
jgi:hypothetical protein